MNIPAVLLAAGAGSRLRPLTNKIPKCLVPFGSKKLLDFWLEQCANNYPVIINTHYLENLVIEHLKNTGHKAIIAPEKKLLGTGGTLLAHKDILQKGAFFAAHADNLSFFDMREFEEAHAKRPAGCIMTMLLFFTDDPQSCGIVQRDNLGIVQGFYEKQKGFFGNLANGAVYMMEPEVLEILANCKKKNPDISLDLLPKCLGKIFTFTRAAYHRDIGTPQSYERALKDYELMCRKTAQRPEKQKQNAGRACKTE